MSKVPSRAMGLISQERYRQIVELKYDEDHDAQWESGELAMAAAVYAICASFVVSELEEDELQKVTGLLWPMQWEYDVLDSLDTENLDDCIEALIQSGALIAAEIDRLLIERDTIQVGGDGGG